MTIDDPVVVTLLEELVHAKREAHLFRVPIWNLSGTRFRDTFAQVVAFFKVEHLRFRPYSLRRGGATVFFSQFGLMEKTLLRGRWASVSVARLYLCDALAQLPSLVATPHTQRLVSQYRAFWSAP